MLNAGNGLFYRDIVSAAVRGEVIFNVGPKLHGWWTKSPPLPDPDPPLKIFVESTPPGPKGQFYELLADIAAEPLYSARLREQRLAERDKLRDIVASNPRCSVWKEILDEQYGDLP